MRVHVMAIDESEEILTFFEALLSEEGYKVTPQTFSTHVLAEVKRVQPDLLILDCGMGQDGPGWQLLQQLKLDRATARIPIVICSGAIRLVRELEGWLGAKGISILLKPFDIEDLLLVTRKMVQALAKTPGRDRPVSGAAAASSSRS